MNNARSPERRTLSDGYASEFPNQIGDPSFLIGAVFMGLETGKPTILCNDLEFSAKINSLGSMLARNNRNPGIITAHRFSYPIDLLGHRNDFSEDADAVAFIDALIEDELKGVAYIPLKTDADKECVVVLVSMREILTHESVCNLSRLVRGHLSAVTFVDDGLGGHGALLTVRERQCLVLTAHGQTDKDAGELLGISANTVRTHLANVRTKLNAKNKTHAVAKAISMNELTLDDLR